MNMFEAVKEFHQAFELPVGKEPNFADSKQRKLRQTLMREEMKEYEDSEMNSDLINLAKELADIIYIACGTAVVYGIPLDKVFEEVHKSNMAKLGPDGKVIRRPDGKVLKPPQWKEPDIKTILGL